MPKEVMIGELTDSSVTNNLNLPSFRVGQLEWGQTFLKWVIITNLYNSKMWNSVNPVSGIWTHNLKNMSLLP